MPTLFHVQYIKHKLILPSFFTSVFDNLPHKSHNIRLEHTALKNKINQPSAKKKIVGAEEMFEVSEPIERRFLSLFV